MTIEERFWDKVKKAGPDDCWEWEASRCRDGYGWFGFQGKMTGSHRVAWILTIGPIPDGLCVLHKCDNPSCVNPNHLWLGTQGENIEDMVDKGRARSGKEKLKPRDILEIRKRLSSGEQQILIAQDYEVNDSTISRIHRKKIWKHV